MPKTYPGIGPFAPGNILTAATMTDIDTNLDNQRVPASVRAYRSTDQTGYVSAANVSWNAEAYDTDGMFTATSTDITVQTAGIYMVTFQGRWDATATVTQHEAYVAVGGNVMLRMYESSPSGTAGRFNVSGLLSLTAAQVVTASVSFVGGSAYIIKGGTDPRADTTSLSLTWVGQTS